MGRLYLIQYCTDIYNEKQKQLAYEVYVADRLKAINDSIANFFGGNAPRYTLIEVLDMMKPKKEPEKTAEQVISSISEKLERLKNERI